jgi:chromosome segregation ATPase
LEEQQRRLYNGLQEFSLMKEDIARKKDVREQIEEKELRLLQQIEEVRDDLKGKIEELANQQKQTRAAGPKSEERIGEMRREMEQAVAKIRELEEQQRGLYNGLQEFSVMKEHIAEKEDVRHSVEEAERRILEEVGRIRDALVKQVEQVMERQESDVKFMMTIIEQNEALQADIRRVGERQHEMEQQFATMNQRIDGLPTPQQYQELARHQQQD